MWKIIDETRMTRNNWTFLGENFDAIHPSLKLFRSMAEQNRQRIRSRYLRALTSEGNSTSMGDVPYAQHREDDDRDEGWPAVGPSVKLCLPPEISLSMSGSNPCWTSSSGRQSRDILTTSSAEISKNNEQEANVSFQPPGENLSNQDTGLDEIGLPIGDWEDYLMDITAQGPQNAMNSPLAGWAPYNDLFGCDQPIPILPKDSAVALLMNDAPKTVFF